MMKYFTTYAAAFAQLLYKSVKRNCLVFFFGFFLVSLCKGLVFFFRCFNDWANYSKSSHQKVFAYCRLEYNMTMQLLTLCCKTYPLYRICSPQYMEQLCHYLQYTCTGTLQTTLGNKQKRYWLNSQVRQLRKIYTPYAVGLSNSWLQMCTFMKHTWPISALKYFSWFHCTFSHLWNISQTVTTTGIEFTVQ